MMNRAQMKKQMQPNVRKLAESVMPSMKSMPMKEPMMPMKAPMKKAMKPMMKTRGR